MLNAQMFGWTQQTEAVVPAGITGHIGGPERDYGIHIFYETLADAL